MQRGLSSVIPQSDATDVARIDGHFGGSRIGSIGTGRRAFLGSRNVATRTHRYARRTRARGGAARTGAARRTASGGGALALLGRAGFLARGIMYIVIGWIALQIAFGHTRQQADRTGALHELSSTALGKVALWVLVVGFI